LGQAIVLTIIGLAMGIAGALGLERFLRSLLYPVAVFDVQTYAAVGLLLIAVALAAGYIPAYRAMRINPTTALRGE
jgi:ABC-type antimicrobial peptide transport system permease subunit